MDHKLHATTKLYKLQIWFSVLILIILGISLPFTYLLIQRSYDTRGKAAETNFPLKKINSTNSTTNALASPIDYIEPTISPVPSTTTTGCSVQSSNFSSLPSSWNLSAGSVVTNGQLKQTLGATDNSQVMISTGIMTGNFSASIDVTQFNSAVAIPAKSATVQLLAGTTSSADRFGIQWTKDGNGSYITLVSIRDGELNSPVNKYFIPTSFVPKLKMIRSGSNLATYVDVGDGAGEILLETLADVISQPVNLIIQTTSPTRHGMSASYDNLVVSCSGIGVSPVPSSLPSSIPSSTPSANLIPSPWEVLPVGSYNVVNIYQYLDGVFTINHPKSFGGFISIFQKKNSGQLIARITNSKSLGLSEAAADSIEAGLSFSSQNNSNYKGANLRTWLTPSGKMLRVGFMRETSGSSPNEEIANIPLPANTSTIWLSISVKPTGAVSGSYSYDGQNWTTFGNTELVIGSSAKFNMYTYGGAGGLIKFDQVQLIQF